MHLEAEDHRLLEDEEPLILSPPRTKKKSRRAVVSRRGALCVAAAVLVLYGVFGPSSWKGRRKIQYTTPSLGLPDELTQSWAQYSPYIPAEKYKIPPAGCTVTQVNIVQRHGARFPTSGAAVRITSALEKLKTSSVYHDRNLEFLRTYQYDLGRNDLLPFGAAQSFDAGQEAFDRYSGIVSKDKPPFVRASSAARVVDSATNWTAGFVYASGGAIVPLAPLILNEAANDTLDDKMCPNAGGPDVQKRRWQSTFAPAVVARLHAAAPGAWQLADADIPDLISLCAFESLAKETESPWCAVFRPQDFADFGYNGDLDKYYKTGYGQRLGPVQGVGYVNELLARLTGTAVHDSTQTNSTLDGSPDTFPLDRALYADFSHDNQMVAIYAALGIVRPAADLDPTRPDPRRTWRVARLVPFSGRLVTERLDCGAAARGGQQAVRMLIDDAVVPLRDVCGAGDDGVCTLDAFVRSQAYARNNGNGDWEKCFS